MSDSISIICTACHLPIPAASPGGFCPRCLLRRGILEEVPGETPNADEPFSASSSRTTGAPFAPDGEDLKEWFPQLEVFERLGAGGMGVVYKARQTHLDRIVALKFLTCPPEFHEAFALRFEQEAKLLANLNHPNIVTLFDFGVVKKDAETLPLHFFLMEYIEGSNLQDCINRNEIAPDQAFQITARICEALQFAHDHGVLHRDIKPANILLSSSGSVKLADFGIAKIRSESLPSQETSLTMTGTSIGTPFYMAPEMWEEPRQADERSDLYSLGAVLYHMLTGEHPSGRFDRPSKSRNLPRIVDAPVWKALAKNPDDRYDDARSLGRDAARISAQLNRFPRLSRKQIILLATILIAGFSVAIWSPLKSSISQSAPRLESPTRGAEEPSSASLQSRVYLHYVGEEQKTNLTSFGRVLADAKIDLVYQRDIESREELPISTEVRYFREPQEKAGAEKVLSLLKELDGFEDARLLYVAGYETDNRSNHFEIWLGRNSFSGEKSIGRKWREKNRSLKEGHLRIAKSSNNVKIDLSNVEEYSDIVEVRATPFHWYALRTNGSLISSHPDHNRRYVESISGGLNRPIAMIDTGGEIEIFENDEKFPPSKYPARLNRHIATACEVGNGHALALLENGEAAAWGPVYASVRRDENNLKVSDETDEYDSARWPPPPALGADNVAIAVTSTHAATLQANGEVLIWGAGGAVDRAELKTHFPIRSIQSGSEAFILLTASGKAIRASVPAQSGKQRELSLEVLGKASVVSSHFYYSERKGWESILMPANSTPLLRKCPEVGPGQISGYPFSDEGSTADQSVVFWVEPK